MAFLAHSGQLLGLALLGATAASWAAATRAALDELMPPQGSVVPGMTVSPLAIQYHATAEAYGRDAAHFAA